MLSFTLKKHNYTFTKYKTNKIKYHIAKVWYWDA